MVHIKDLTGLILNRDISEKDTIYLSKVMRRVIFSAPSTRVLDLLLEMRIKRTHMAVVVDEHGHDEHGGIGETLETIFTVLGGLVLLGAHYLNIRFTNKTI